MLKSKTTGSARITILDYDEQHFQERKAEVVEEPSPPRDRPTVTWINVDGLQPETVEKIGESFGLHPLVVEAILNRDQRPKLEDFVDYLYIVLKMLSYDDKANEIATEQVSLILGSNYVLSFQEEREGDVFNPIRERIRSEKASRIRKMGVDYLVYSLMDSVVDSYFTILEKVGERIEFLEEELVAKPTPTVLQAIHDLRREMISLRKSVWPLREVISGLERGESKLIGEEAQVYFRNLYDHTIQVIDSVETSRDIISGMLEIYLSSISNKMNEVMKVLTIIATIFMPLTLIAGIYGMNFRYMPELEAPWGYPLAWVAMLIVAGLMLLYFRRKRWI
jgi:magnesium transporter